MRQSVLESPEQRQEAALLETRRLLDQIRTAGTLTALAAAAALLMALVALVVALRTV
jgi:hypothetical protein